MIVYMLQNPREQNLDRNTHHHPSLLILTSTSPPPPPQSTSLELVTSLLLEFFDPSRTDPLLRPLANRPLLTHQVLVVSRLDHHTPEDAPPRPLSRPLALLQPFTADETHGLAVPVLGHLDRDPARQTQHDAVRAEGQEVVAEVRCQQVLQGSNMVSGAPTLLGHDGHTSGPNTTSCLRRAFV